MACIASNCQISILGEMLCEDRLKNQKVKNDMDDTIYDETESIMGESDDEDDWNGLLNDIDTQDLIDTEVIINSIHKESNSDKDDINLENTIDIDNSKNIHKICSKCQITCIIKDGQLVCGTCGEIIGVCENVEQYSISTDKGHNTSNNSFMSFNIIGKNAYCYQRSFLKTCADYTSYRKNNNKKDMYNHAYQYDGKKPPKDVIKIAVEIFSKIKDAGYVFRGKKKKGVQGACLFYACVIKGLTKPPREIASIMGIEERFLSHGDRILQDLNERGVISIPTILRPMKDYINQYFPALNIDDKYKDFVMAIIDRAEKKNIHIKNDSRTTTKVIGAIYLLVTRIPELRKITKEKIVKECNISKSTFIRYFNLLNANHTLLKKTFKRYRIPIDTKYRPKKIET